MDPETLKSVFSFLGARVWITIGSRVCHYWNQTLSQRDRLKKETLFPTVCRQIQQYSADKDDPNRFELDEGRCAWMLSTVNSPIVFHSLPEFSRPDASPFHLCHDASSARVYTLNQKSLIDISSEKRWALPSQDLIFSFSVCQRVLYLEFSDRETFYFLEQNGTMKELFGQKMHSWQNAKLFLWNTNIIVTRPVENCFNEISRFNVSHVIDSSHRFIKTPYTPLIYGILSTRCLAFLDHSFYVFSTNDKSLLRFECF